MAIEILIGKKALQVELLSRKDNRVLVEVDGRKYDLDVRMVEEGMFSVLHEGKSFNLELIEGDGPRKYTVNTYRSSFEAEVVDAEAKYLRSREKAIGGESDKAIITPMPGKVVRIMVGTGEEVSAGQNLIVVEAMKMQNEYRAPVSGKVAKILVNEGDTVNARQVLINLE